MKILEAWHIYKSGKKLSPYTISAMEDTFFPWAGVAQNKTKSLDEIKSEGKELPSVAFEVNQYLTTLNFAEVTRHLHRRHIVSLYKYLHEQMDFPDFTKKITKIKIPKSKRRYFSQLELRKIYLACKTPLEKALLYTFVYSPCREGELGRHPLKDGSEYPGLRVEMLSDPFTVEDPITHEPILSCNMNVIGKKGPVSYHLDPEIRNMHLSIAAPNGQVFTTKYSPNGMTSKAIQNMMRELIIRAGTTGKKLGPHSFRHTSASLIARKTGSVLAVMAGIQDSETKSAMIYIHDVEDELKHTSSVSSIIRNEIFGNSKEIVQGNLLTSGEISDSTALVPYGEQIEHVEGEIDLSEELYPEVPDNLEKRPRLRSSDLKAMRKAFIHYTRTAPQDGLSGQLAQLMKSILSR